MVATVERGLGRRPDPHAVMRGTKVGVRLFGFVEYAISLLPNISKAALTIGKEKTYIKSSL